MDKESGKPAWPKPSRRYRTITGRRYGRRYAYVGFTPSSDSQVGDEHQHNEDHKRLELEDIQKANSLGEPLLENTGTGEPVCASVSSQTLEVNMSPFSLFSYGLEGNQISGNFMKPDKNFEGLAEYATAGCNDWNGQNGIAFVNMDSYKPHGGAGEDHTHDEFSLGTEEAVVFQETRNKIYSQFEKVRESFTDLQSQLSGLNHSVTRECCEEAGPMPLMRYFSIDSDLACPNSRTSKTSDEDQAILKSNPSDTVHEVRQIKSRENVEIQTPRAIANELHVIDDQGSSLELVVRPKIRKQNTSNELEKERLLLDDEEGESISWRRTETDEVQQGCAECALNSKDTNSSMFFGSRGHEAHRNNTELRKNAAAQERKNVLEDSTSWDGLEDCSRHLPMYRKDEDSSECSDGEWSAAAPAYFTATEKDHSSAESCETIPGREKCEPEVQSSSSSGAEEESKDCCSQGGQPLLEEGEIPPLQNQQVENISDVEANLLHNFMYSGFFLLAGNDSLEDDSSESEDLNSDQRPRSESGNGLGVAQAASNVYSITFESLEERLQEAMEKTVDEDVEVFHKFKNVISFTEKNALAHLGLLGFEVDEAHPPATKEMIDSLPQVVITNDQDGQEQRCIICCCEYVENEIITELPCHHLFHRTCVTLWLKESGTCPVCRRVLARVPPETAAATVSFLPDHDLASSAHSITGTTN